MSLFSSLSARTMSAGLIATGILASASVFAEDTPVTLPSTGVDVAGLATAAITSLGAVLAVVVAGTVAFYLVRIGIRWIKGIGGR